MFRLNILIIFFYILNLKIALSENYINQNSIKDDLNCEFIIFENLTYLAPNSEIQIRIPKSSKWNQNLLAAQLDKDTGIKDKYKKKFYATVALRDNNSKKECSIPAEIRLSGNGKDNINAINKKNQPKSSMDVTLKKGNINNITSFKLALPEAKEGRNFIILRNILSELKFITPRTKFVSVKLNNNDLDKYIFFEKPNKEMIEFNKKKEGPIISMDISNFWRNDGRKDPIITEISNSNWASRNNLNIGMSKEVLDAISKIYLEYNQRFIIEKKNDIRDVNFNILEKDGYDISEITRYNLALIAFNAQHGLYPENRKYFFEPLTKKIFTISNDEDPLFTVYNKKFIEENNFYIDFSHYNKFLSDLDNIDRNKILIQIQNSGVEKFNIRELDDIINNAKKNLILYKENYKIVNLISSDFTNYYKKNNIFFYKKNFFTKYKSNKLILEECDKQMFKCKEIEKNDKLLAKIFANKIKNSRYILDKNYYENLDLSKKKNKIKKIVFNKGFLFFNDSINFSIDENKKIIEINQFDIDSRFVFYEVDLTNYKIIFNGKKDLNFEPNLAVRYTEDNLTGCLNIINSVFKNTKIESNFSNCEDSINIAGSKGVVNYVKINESLFDGLDVDFSEILFKNIQITNSKNDCLDMSYGKYVIEEISTFNCGDKGISLGEKSQLNLLKFKNENSIVGLAVKDSSVSWVKSINNLNTDYCVLAYRKKQEFSGGQVYINSNDNNCKNNSYYNDKQSIIIFE